MSYSRDSVIEAYGRLKNLKAVCQETGAPPYNAFIWLKKAGLLTLTDKTVYGTSSSRLGAEAEKEFQRLVPLAMSANTQLQNNCPAFDFCISDFTVDVKFSALRKTGRWGFKTGFEKAMQPDFYAAFFATDKKGELKKGYHLLLIPSEVIGERGCIELSPDAKNSDWWLFKVTPENLAEHLAA